MLRGRMPDGALGEQLRLGAILFRAGLVVFGGSVIAAMRLPVWRQPRPALRERPGEGSAALAISCIAVAAFALRLYKLNSGLWLDEILTYVNYARMPFGEIVSTYFNENQHFLYTILAHACFVMFGESAWALRLPAVLFGAASIVALYLLGREVTGRRESLFACALFAVSYHHVWFSQNARGYSGLLFWTLLSSWLLLRALREGRPGLWIWYAVSATLGVYTHITMLFVIAGQFLSYLYQIYARRQESWPHRWTGLILGFCGATLLTFELHALVLPQIFGGMAKTVSVVEEWKNPLWTLLEIFRGLQANFAGSAVALAAVGIFAVGVWSFARSFPILLQLFLIPPILGATLVISAGHHLWPRFFFFAFGFGGLVAIRGAMVVEQAITGRFGRQAPGVLCVGLLVVSAASVPFAFGPKQDYAGALKFVEANRQPGDAVVTVGLATFPYHELYRPGWRAVENIDELNAVRSQSTRTVLLYTLEPVLESMSPEIMASVKRDFRVWKQFRGTLENGTVFVCLAEQHAATEASKKDPVL